MNMKARQDKDSRNIPSKIDSQSFGQVNQSKSTLKEQLSKNTVKE
jgi:hypothetical protein